MLGKPAKSITQNTFDSDKVIKSSSHSLYEPQSLGAKRVLALLVHGQGEGITFIRGGHCRAFWMNLSQAAALLAVSGSSPAIGMAEALF